MGRKPKTEWVRWGEMEGKNTAENKRLIKRVTKLDETSITNVQIMFDTVCTTCDRKLNLKVRQAAANGAKTGNPSESVQWYEIYYKTLLYASHYDLDSYLLYLEKNRDVDKRFYQPRRKVLAPVVAALQDLVDDKLDILSISLPPGTGKSTLGIFFMSWMAGRFPNNPNLMSAHSGILTRSFYEGLLQIFNDTDEYTWHDIFPGINVSATNSKEETIDIDKLQRFKTITCRAINASLTGATRCEGILYADDLVSGIEEAMSMERLDKLWSSYTNDLKSRKKNGCKEIHVATRWSVHDIIGRLENLYEGNSRARFLVIPALDETGKSNFDYDYNVGFDTAYFKDMEKTLDDASFKALYMNEPIEREGLLYDADELRRYYELPNIEPDAILGVCDTAEGGNDYTFLPVAYQYGEDFYIDDCVCFNGTPDKSEPMCASLLCRNKVQMCQFESNSAGSKIADSVQKMVRQQNGITHITKKRTTQNKVTKIVVNSAYVKEHFLFKDPTMYTVKSEYGKMMNFLCSYTMMGKNKFDDVPDGMAQLALYVQNLVGKKCEVIERIF